MAALLLAAVAVSALCGAGAGGEGAAAVFPYEMCSEERGRYSRAEFERYLAAGGRRPPDIRFDILDYDALCGGDGSVSAALEAAWAERYTALVGSAELPACELLTRVASFKRKPFLSWACLQGGGAGSAGAVAWRAQPSVREAAGAVALAADALRWRSVVVLTAEGGWWWELAQLVERHLLELGLTPRRVHLAPRAWRRSLARLHAVAPAAVILCTSHRPEISGKILQAFESFHILPSMVLLIDYFKYILPNKLSQVNSNENDRGGTSSPDGLMLGDAPSGHTRGLLDEPHSSPIAMSSHRINFTEDLSPWTHRTFNIVDANFYKKEKLRADEPNVNIITTSPTSHNSIENIADAAKIFSSPSDAVVLALGDRRAAPRLRQDVKINSASRANNAANDVADLGKNILNDIIVDKFRTIKQFTKENKQRGDGTADPTVSPHEKRNEWNGSFNIPDRKYTSSSPPRGHRTPARDARGRRPSFPPVAPAASAAPTNKSHLAKNTTREHRRRKRSAKGDSTLNEFFYFDLSISRALRDRLLVITDRRLDGRKVPSRPGEVRSEVFEHVYEALAAARRPLAPERSVELEVLERVYETTSASLLRYADIVPVWRPVLSVRARSRGGGPVSPEPPLAFNLTRKLRNFEEWLAERGFPEVEEDCDEDFCISSKITMSALHIFAIIAGSLLLSALLLGLAIAIRNMLVTRRLSKRPNKVVLMAGDFVFPQVADSRRVDEGMEAMLCCWLQQLQEFGGPEVDKPDLLKGSVGSLKGLGTNMNSNNAAKGPSSNASIAKSACIIDPRTRYNGDFVQMKYFASVGAFELKRKSTDLLVLMQSLRHENLNPFIGCLCEPSRPAIVFEYCSRGSLEDVLVADEIKLDWTFRLSLLTDLVRGMRYLHSTALRTHGHLTSRNCVVDARWVLKLTDYGMPAFYRAQGMPPPLKSARELLWTAPELLRDAVLRERGTQPGDVYSFAIVMQEVILRGEPYCMHKFSPEEIIEKVKRPPPLIRPSVSKGAAPPEAINIMRQCWTEAPDMRPDFNAVHDLFRKLNHGRKVNFIDTMFQMLEKYSNNLEELIRERTDQLDMEKKKTEQLLNRMLPSYVAEKLKLGMPVDPEEFGEVSIYFSDIVGFTSIAAHSSPFQVVDLLNDLYTTFDATINHYNVYKVETIGDAYMVVGGLPVRTSDHAEQVATMALHLLHHAGKFRIRHLPRTPLRLRIGLHTGPCCAGVVGLTMPRYCLFGDTVNTASRMESTGAAWRIHLSEATRDKLEVAGGYALEYRGNTDIKGKGKMHTYWLLGKAGFDNPLPTPPRLGESDGLEESLIVEKGALSVSSSLLHKSDDNSSDTSAHALAIGGSGGGGGESSPEPPPPPDPTTQQVIDMRKMNYCKQSSGDAYQRKPDSSAESTAVVTPASPPPAPAPVDGRTLALNAPVSAVEVAAALLGASSTSLARDRRDLSRYKRSTLADCDLSAPYARYKCFSPSDTNLVRSTDVRVAAGRLLKRQFSLDRADEPASGAEGGRAVGPARLTKQNSAGAAPDLERIEEVPMALSPRRYRTRPSPPHPSSAATLSPFSSFPSATSVSAESLTDSRLFLSSTMKR